MTFNFKAILTENGWLTNAEVTVDKEGKILSIKSSPDNLAFAEGFALPGFQNAHSHAFQYAMAGLTEYFEGNDVPDDFWNWRNAMYNVALSLSPDDMQHVATQLYAEMLRHGYTEVAEFHYVHQDFNGKPYNNLSEIGERLVLAAKTAGIRITLIPVFYKNGNFGQAPNPLQRRFISRSFEDYAALFEASKKSVSFYKNAGLGVSVHSLRAVDAADVVQTAQFNKHLPFHIHVAEQLKEVQDCLKFYGKRPVEWLFENVEVNERYHLVHSTHLTDDEVFKIAKSGAQVVLCPSTEGNLGDGRFRFKEFQNLKGRWSIGTDSQIGIDFFQDLRLLDYSQRINTHKRDTFFLPNEGDSGFNAIKMSWQSGRKAMGKSSEKFFEIGEPFDAVVMDSESALLATASFKNLCNTMVYSSDVSHIFGTILDGNWVVKNGQHQKKEEINKAFIETIKALKLR